MRSAMRLSPDELIFWQHGFIKLNATVVTTWGLMLVLTLGARLITRKLVAETSATSLRVMSLAPRVSTSISPQVVTTVALSFIKPCCQKISSSGLRRMADLICESSEPRHDCACDQKSKQAHQQPLPVTA